MERSREEEEEAKVGDRMAITTNFLLVITCIFLQSSQPDLRIFKPSDWSYD